jgi:hypothetical protein
VTDRAASQEPPRANGRLWPNRGGWSSERVSHLSFSGVGGSDVGQADRSINWPIGARDGAEKIGSGREMIGGRLTTVARCAR